MGKVGCGGKAGEGWVEGKNVEGRLGRGKERERSDGIGGGWSKEGGFREVRQGQGAFGATIIRGLEAIGQINKTRGYRGPANRLGDKKTEMAFLGGFGSGVRTVNLGRFRFGFYGDWFGKFF
jgi:hypothetical protein